MMLFSGCMTFSVRIKVSMQNQIDEGQHEPHALASGCRASTSAGMLGEYITSHNHQQT